MSKFRVLEFVLNFRKFNDFQTSSHLSGVTTQVSVCPYVRLRALSDSRAAEQIYINFQSDTSLTRASKSQNRGIPI